MAVWPPGVTMGSSARPTRRIVQIPLLRYALKAPQSHVPERSYPK